MVIVHHVERILHSTTTTDGNGIVDHTVLGTLHNGHLAGLFLDGHILVNDTNTTFTRYGNGHGCLRNGIHCRCDKGNIQFDVTGKLGFQLYLFGQHL